MLLIDLQSGALIIEASSSSGGGAAGGGGQAGHIGPYREALWQTIIDYGLKLAAGPADGGQGGGGGGGGGIGAGPQFSLPSQPLALPAATGPQEAGGQEAGGAGLEPAARGAQLHFGSGYLEMDFSELSAGQASAGSRVSRAAQVTHNPQPPLHAAPCRPCLVQPPGL